MSSQLQLIISAVGFIQGVVLFAVLISDSRVNGASRILGIQCLFLALLFILPFVSQGGSNLVWGFGWLFYLPASFGGLLYLYCRNSVLDQRLKPVDLLHTVPLLACYVLSIDYLLFKPNEFIQWVVGETGYVARLQVTEFIIFIQAFGYAFITAVFLKRSQQQAIQTLSNFNHAIFRWLWVLIVFSAVIWLIKAVASFTIVDQTVVLASDLLIVIMIYTIAVMQWRNPKLFTVDDLPKQTTTNRGALSNDLRANFFESLKHKVEADKLYRDSGLTLATLAEQTGLSTHHLSESLNQHEGKNFYQFINAYRVEDVCQRIQSGDQNKLLDIALKAGFASKSSFNSIFKQTTGMTPTQYKQHLAN